MEPLLCGVGAALPKGAPGPSHSSSLRAGPGAASFPQRLFAKITTADLVTTTPMAAGLESKCIP